MTTDKQLAKEFATKIKKGMDDARKDGAAMERQRILDLLPKVFQENTLFEMYNKGQLDFIERLKKLLTEPK